MHNHPDNTKFYKTIWSNKTFQWYAHERLSSSSNALYSSHQWNKSSNNKESNRVFHVYHNM